MRELSDWSHEWLVGGKPPVEQCVGCTGGDRKAGTCVRSVRHAGGLPARDGAILCADATTGVMVFRV